MSGKERARLQVMSRVRDGQLGLGAAAGLLGISYRQARRAYQRFRAEGDAGLVHRLRGRASNRKADDATRRARRCWRCTGRSTTTSARRWRASTWRRPTGTR